MPKATKAPPRERRGACLYDVLVMRASGQLGVGEKEVRSQIQKEPSWGILPPHRVAERWMRSKGIALGLPSQLETAPGKIAAKPEGEPKRLIELAPGDFRFVRGTIVGLRDLSVYGVCPVCRAALKGGKCPACGGTERMANLGLEFYLVDDDSQIMCRSYIKEVNECLLGVTTEEVQEEIDRARKAGVGPGELTPWLVLKYTPLVACKDVAVSGRAVMEKEFGLVLRVFWFEEFDHKCGQPKFDRGMDSLYTKLKEGLARFG